MDTIFAPATARGKAGVSVVRISGPRAFDVVGKMIASLPTSHKAALRRVHDLHGEVLDEALVIAFPEGQSFTGEPTVEIQLHGSLAIIGAVMRNLADIEGFRLANPGEFTRRALENNRLDLTQVEGLADLIDAETEAQRRQAQRVLSGAVGRLAAEWRADLTRAKALLEATIDFADEDVPEDVAPEVLELLDRTLESLREQQIGGAVAERVRESFEIAIIGAPNVGKSTLLNALAGRDAAITAETAGTTRDVIEVRMDLGGVPVVFLDTAGLRETEDMVEKMGIARARARAVDADLRILVVEREGEWPEIELQAHDIVVVGKSDLGKESDPGISGKTGQGIETLVENCRVMLATRVASAGVLIRERHRQAVGRGIAAIVEARIEVCRGAGRQEFAAEHLRAAVNALDSLVGKIGVEDVLGEIFASFCLGK